MSEYRWRWGTPYKIGVWMYGGRDPGKQSEPSISIVRSNLSFDPGWFCFLMDVPEVLPPKKTVTEVLWVKLPDQNEGKFSTEAAWARQGEMLLSTQEIQWIPTSITRSYER